MSGTGCSQEATLWGSSLNLPPTWGWWWKQEGPCAGSQEVSFLTLLTVLLRTKLYSADLESGLHYLLRVELAAHKSLAGTQLKTFKDFMTVIAKVWLVLLRL